MEQLETLFQDLQAQEDEMLQTLETFVNLPSAGREYQDSNAFSAWLKEFLESEGMQCRLLDVGNPEKGKTLVADWGAERPGAPILFSGHLDTALYRRQMPENPFGIEGDHVHGVGVLDMKGGIVIALYVLRALRSIGYQDRPVRFLWSGDEEGGHYGSRGGQVMAEQAKGCYCAFHMETGLESNALVVSRKGGTRCKITVTGVEAHSGNDFLKGRNAIIEMCHKIERIHALTDLDAGTTLNIGTINGGRLITSVPDRCEVVVDMRFRDNRQMELTRQRLEEICRTTYIEGTSTSFEYINHMHVFEQTQAGMDFFRFVQRTAEKYHLPPVTATTLGGSSDAAYTTQAGVPTICSFGAMGRYNHTTQEYIQKGSLVQRAKLILACILDPEFSEWRAAAYES